MTRTDTAVTWTRQEHGRDNGPYGRGHGRERGHGHGHAQRRCFGACIGIQHSGAPIVLKYSSI